MIVDLDAEAGLDPGRVGSKAAWLALGRRAGLPVLPGLVVESMASGDHMRLGAETLPTRGSGGARLSVMQQPIAFGDPLITAASRLGPTVVARSSTQLEGGGQWSGAFSSYLDLTPPDLPQAVVGCWASAFTVAALERQAAAGVEPGSFTMAVLVQPCLEPEAGGTAEIGDDGAIVVHGIKGSPAPLLQGWATGESAVRDERWTGDGLIDLVGLPVLDDIAQVMRKASSSLGVTHCEWALDGQIWFLQLGARSSIPTRPTAPFPVESVDPRLTRIVRVVVSAQGRIREQLVLPWALGGLPEPAPPVEEKPGDALALATRLRDELVSEVWSMPAAEALETARSCTARLLGPEPGPALDLIDRLRSPDPARAGRALGLATTLQAEDDRMVIRRGAGRWEPFIASVVLARGIHHRGTIASNGVGAGVRCDVGHPDDLDRFSPRSVVTAPQPISNLAPVLWDASALVTEAGSPAAHLFESARALGIPAVCGVKLPAGDQIVAVDGYTGTVATLPMIGDDDD
ncbi:MAG TPA: PEP-utilizing enzyme [Acidimicrobiia bacterium]